MNGNANLNANNLTAQNVQDWQTKLGIGAERRTELLYIAVTNANTDYALNDSIANYNWLVIRFRVAGSEYAWGVIPCSMILEQNNTYSNIVSTDSRWLSFYILRNTPSTIHIVGTGHNSTANGKNNLWICGIK